MKTDQDAIKELSEDELFCLFGRIKERIMKARKDQYEKITGQNWEKNVTINEKVLTTDSEVFRAIKSLKRRVKK